MVLYSTKIQYYSYENTMRIIIKNNGNYTWKTTPGCITVMRISGEMCLVYYLWNNATMPNWALCTFCKNIISHGFGVKCKLDLFSWDSFSGSQIDLHLGKSFKISGQCCSSDKHAHTHIDLCLETRKIDQSKPHLDTLLRLDNKQMCLFIWTIQNSESLAKLVMRQKCIYGIDSETVCG